MNDRVAAPATRAVALCAAVLAAAALIQGQTQTPAPAAPAAQPATPPPADFLKRPPVVRQPPEVHPDAAVEGGDGVDLPIAVLQRLDLHEAQPSAALEQDLGGGLVVAALVDELDGAVQVGLALRDALGERERIAGLDQHMEAPAGHLVAFRLPLLRKLCHFRSHSGVRFVLP